MPRLDLDPTVPRVVAVGILLFVTTFVGPLGNIFGQGRMPTIEEVAFYLCLAIVVTCEFLMAFFKMGETTPK